MRAVSLPRLMAVASVCALLLGACGNDDSGDAGGEELQPVPTGDAEDLTGESLVELLARDNVFVPQEIQVDPGTTVRWTNRGMNDHNILDASEGWSDATLPPEGFEAPTEEFTPGDVYEFAFDEPGTYAYYCSLHGTENSGMIGTVVVGTPDAAS